MTYNPSLRILSVCAGGNVRSVTIARLLKLHHQYPQPDTLAVGVWTCSTETFDMLAQWANLIIVCGERALWERVPFRYYDKSYHLDIGLDRWDTAMHSDLVDIIKNKLETDHVLRQRLGWE